MGFDGLDINMGCPVRKIIERGSCGALIRNPSLASELIAAAKDGARGLPVSVKTRIGISSSRAEEWLGFLLAQRIAALTVHGAPSPSSRRAPRTGAPWPLLSGFETRRRPAPSSSATAM